MKLAPRFIVNDVLPPKDRSPRRVDDSRKAAILALVERRNDAILYADRTGLDATYCRMTSGDKALRCQATTIEQSDFSPVQMRLPILISWLLEAAQRELSVSLRFFVMAESLRADRNGHGGLTPSRSPVLLTWGSVHPGHKRRYRTGL